MRSTSRATAAPSGLPQNEWPYQKARSSAPRKPRSTRSRGEGRRHRQHAAREALRRAEEVRRDAGVVARPHRAAAAVAGEHLVGDEQHVVAVAELARALQERGIRGAHARGALDHGLEHHGGDLAAVSLERVGEGLRRRLRSRRRETGCAAAPGARRRRGGGRPRRRRSRWRPGSRRGRRRRGRRSACARAALPGASTGARASARPRPRWSRRRCRRRARGPGARPGTAPRRARAAASWVMPASAEWQLRSAWRRSASTRRGWLWPRAATHQDELASM